MKGSLDEMSLEHKGYTGLRRQNARTAESSGEGWVNLEEQRSLPLPTPGSEDFALLSRPHLKGQNSKIIFSLLRHFCILLSLPITCSLPRATSRRLTRFLSHFTSHQNMPRRQYRSSLDPAQGNVLCFSCFVLLIKK